MSGIIGEMIRQWRVVRDIKQNDLAKEIGIGASTLCRLEAGEDVDLNAGLKIINWMMGVKP